MCAVYWANIIFRLLWYLYKIQSEENSQEKTVESPPTVPGPPTEKEKKLRNLRKVCTLQIFTLLLHDITNCRITNLKTFVVNANKRILKIQG